MITRKKMEKIAIVHAMNSYGRESETFIWQYLRQFENTVPVIMADSLQNLDQFPLPGRKIYAFSLSRWTWPWIKDNFYRRLMRRKMGLREQIVRNEKIKLIHAHFGFIGYSYLKISTILNLPVITTFYGYDLYRKDIIRRYKKAYDQLFFNGAHFFVEGPCMRQRLIALGCPNEKISIQRIALDLTKYETKQRNKESRQPVRLLFVGRFVEKKGLEYALKALAKLKNDYCFRFKIIGNGELKNSLRILAQRLGLTNKIDWAGVQPHSNVIQNLKTCDLLLQPSVTANNGDSEGGAPTIILEAQACGVPVVSTTHADIPYITKNSESALLAPERDAEALAKNIGFLFDHRDLWAQMGKEGRRHVEKNHDIKKEVKTLEYRYRKILFEFRMSAN